jgi:hypothetical protein
MSIFSANPSLLKDDPVFSDNREVNCQIDTANWTSSPEYDSVFVRLFNPSRHEQASR